LARDVLLFRRKPYQAALRGSLRERKRRRIEEIVLPEESGEENDSDVGSGDEEKMRGPRASE
jgi:hypothetical protein